MFSSFPSLQMLTGFSSHICASTPKGTPYMCPNFLAEVISLLYVLFEVLVPQESGVANLQSWYASHVHTSGTPITNYPRLRQVSCIDHLFFFCKKQYIPKLGSAWHSIFDTLWIYYLFVNRSCSNRFHKIMMEKKLD